MSVEIFNKAQGLLEEIQQDAPKTKDELEQFRIKYIGSKGAVKRLFGEIRNVDNDRKREFGQLANSIKQQAEAKLMS